MRITVKLLKELGACDDGIEEFKEFLGKRKYVLPTRRNLQLAMSAGLPVEWLISRASLTVGPLVYPSGTEFWYKDGLIHREGGPAVTHADGRQVWQYDGLLHRVGGPAVTYPDGAGSWYQKGLLHRDGGPAVTYPDESQFWFQNGRLHRDDGPAVIYASGPQFWYQDGASLPTPSNLQAVVYKNKGVENEDYG